MEFLGKSATPSMRQDTSRVSLSTLRPSLRRIGLWNVQQKCANCQQPILKRLSDLIGRLTSRLLFDDRYLQSCKSSTRSILLNAMTLFMMFALQRLCGLSHEEIEFQVNGRRSVEEYLVHGMMKRLPACSI
jgi:IS5 family transposase